MYSFFTIEKIHISCIPYSGTKFLEIDFSRRATGDTSTSAEAQSILEKTRIEVGVLPSFEICSINLDQF